MICDQLPNTGLGTERSVVLVVALACIAAGVCATLLRHRAARSTATASASASGSATMTTASATIAVLLAVLLAGTATVLLPAPAAQAAASGCSATDAGVRVQQTSTMLLAPGLAPVGITGLVTNTGSETQLIVAVDVEIVSVTMQPGSAASTCDSSDYLLLDSRMPVGRTIEAGASIAFAGASIGFSDKTSVQDACQRAIVNLLYTVNPRGPANRVEVVRSAVER
ncbi:hypothetical protein [Herbiconiux daphne]|uniref:Uncharacterized protein n=1 Tax=Herbiconiux daphne TaxID=2970914 RepID=A0ABT2H0N7_9MICO|nr:hypothetical protein [Herbiconiux daphne]MCS5733502.1 hypothetical protein [Herbiconiux daphne]